MKLTVMGVAILTIMANIFAYADSGLGFRSNTKISNSAPNQMISKLSNLNHGSIPESSINATTKGIQLHFQDYPLGEILKNIHDEAGIHFNLSPKMANNSISIHIEAKNWKNSVQKLIADYSRLEVWTNQPKTSRIWLMKSTPRD